MTMRRHRHARCLFAAICLGVAAITTNAAQDWVDAASAPLAQGNAASSQGRFDEALGHYASAMQRLPPRWSGDGREVDADSPASDLPDGTGMELILSLHANYGTALSSAHGSTDERALSAYRAACRHYRQWQTAQARSDGDRRPREARGGGRIDAIATQSYFFLGMTYQDLAPAERDPERQQRALQKATMAYAEATAIDPRHWSSFANMAVALADVGDTVSLGLHEEAILAYQKAIRILSVLLENEGGEDHPAPTDPPENVRETVAELQYRIGLCLVPFLFADAPREGGVDGEKQCTLTIGRGSAPTTRSCLELGAFQFQTALDFHPRHEGARSALTLVTADATFGMSTSPQKVRQLFEDYAETFERSLVDELRYDGFHRMRRSFDRVMASEGIENTIFPLVIDAGCGTGLAGEAFHNLTETLVGIDLSPSIVQLAKESRPNLYDEFIVGDIQEILHRYASQKKYTSLIVAADAFIYFNDLNTLLGRVSSGLEEGGYIVFSLENVSYENEQQLQELKPEWSWQLTPSGRVAHRKEYVEKTARAHSLDTVLYETLDNFREENGVGVRGHLFVLKKQKEKRDEL